MKRLLIAAATLVSVVVAAEASYVTFRGQNNNLSAPIGSLYVGTNWSSGTLPSGSSTGLVTATSNVWAGTTWNNLAVRQTGGYVSGSTAFNMRGGTSGSGVTTVYEIEDSRTDYASYTNFYVNGQMTLWSQYGEKINLNLLSGHIEANALSLNATNATVNFRDGIFHTADMVTGKAVVNMLAGGTGAFIIDNLSTSLGNAMVLNFETGNQGSIYIGQKTGGTTAGGTWQYLIGNGQVSIDGVVTTDVSKFSIVGSGLSTSIQLIPEPATIGMLGLGAFIILFARRKIR